MGFEFPMEKKSNEAFDDNWYSQFKEIASFQDYEYLTGEKEYRKTQKADFLGGKIENPELDYPELQKIDFSKKENELVVLKRDILKNESSAVVRQAYRWKINEKIAELKMLQAAKEGNDNKFFKYSKFIYGEPDKKIFSFDLYQIKNLVKNSMYSFSPDIAVAAQQIYFELFSAHPNRYETTDIDQSPISNIQPLRPLRERGREYTAEEIRSAFEGALEIFQVKGFKVVLVEGGKNKKISVNQEKSTVNVPADRKLKESELRSLLVHEIGTHTQRRSRGEDSKLKLLGLGLDRYLRGEEGVAMYSEQQIRGATDYAGFDGHLAVSLSIGLDGKKRNFREVFSVLEKYFFIRSRKNDARAVERARDAAWDRCVRTFRGTSCKNPGVCFTRDIVYREGNIGIWNIVKNKPSEVKRFSIGKYDPANPRHIWILDQLGITEESLTALDKDSDS
jgi:hypothetical protein